MMNTHLLPRLLGIIICISVAFIAKGQFDLTNADLHDDGDKLIIEYRIINSGPSDRFLINVHITDADGNIIDAFSLTGDIGQNVAGGLKRITWEYKKDDIIYETAITVKIKYKKQSPKTEVPPSMIESSTKSYTRSGLILQSLALPGLGMTKLKGKPYWIYGVVGYGLVGYSIYNYLNNINGVYKDYEDGNATYEEYETAYDNNINKTLYSACGAAAIWLTDFILISVSSKNVNQYSNRKIQIAPGYDYRTKSPMLSMTYKF